MKDWPIYIARLVFISWSEGPKPVYPRLRLNSLDRSVFPEQVFTTRTDKKYLSLMGRVGLVFPACTTTLVCNCVMGLVFPAPDR